jgi:histidinol-phosphate aminotransferase
MTPAAAATEASAGPASAARAVHALARPEIARLERPSRMMDDPTTGRLHANESPWRAPLDGSIAGLNRYPEPEPLMLEARLAALYGVAPNRVLATRGSDDGIDLLVRTFCRPGRDAVLTCPPTFGMYAHCAQLHGAPLVEVPLRAADGFSLDEDELLAAAAPTVRLVFLCSPNNPTGNALADGTALRIAKALAGQAIVVVDEAYAEFHAGTSLVERLAAHPNLVVLRTLSKALALAGARCGAVLGDEDVIDLLARARPPYSIPTPSSEAVLAALTPASLAALEARAASLAGARATVAAALESLPAVRKVHASDANFLLVAFRDAVAARAALAGVGISVRDLSAGRHTPGCLRLSIGSADDNAKLVAALGRLAP